MSSSRQNFRSLVLITSNEYFRLFFKESGAPGLEISISKKFFKLAVKRNRVKRIIKDVIRKKSLLVNVEGVIVFSVFGPFERLTYLEASKKIESAIMGLRENKE